MGAYDFNELKSHIGHRIVCTSYGDPPANVAVECEDCNEVLMDYDRPDNSPMDMINAREEQEEVHQARNELRERLGKELASGTTLSSIEEFRRHALDLVSAHCAGEPNVLQTSQSRGVQTLVREDGSTRMLPNDSEYMLTVKIGKCFHQWRHGFCTKCETRQRDEDE